MSEIIVYSVPGSPYGRAVCATLEEKGTPYRFATVAAEARHSEPHVSRHPFGRIPVLQHGDFLLYETQAILRYLDRTQPAPPLSPESAQDAARMDQVMNICDWYLFQGVNNVIGFQRIVKPRLLGLAADEAAVAEAMPRAHNVFRVLSRLLGSKRYFVGEGLSLGDMMVAPQLDLLAQTLEWPALVADAPNLVAWLQHITARKSFEATTWLRLAELAQAA